MGCDSWENCLCIYREPITRTAVNARQRQWERAAARERREGGKKSERDSEVEQVGGKRGDKTDRTKSGKMHVEGSH